MSVRAARWTVFAVLVLAAPVPMLGPFDAFAPAARYALLLAAGGAVAVAEGAGGPVPLILGLFAAQTLGSLALLLVAAWVVARASAPLSGRARAALVALACAALLLWSLAGEPYRTPFGRAPTADLIGALS